MIATTKSAGAKKKLAALAAAATLLAAGLALMLVNNRFPQFFNLVYDQESRKPEALSGGSYFQTSGPPADLKKGLMTADTLLAIGGELCANWLPNDKIWPTVFLDNAPNFQLGELEMLRYTARVMRDKLTRLRTTDRIDPDCDQAFTFLSNDPLKWLFPSAESRFRAAEDSLRQYRARLAAGQAEFYPRADNLSELLDQYASLLGGVNTRLANAPERRRFKASEGSAGETAASRPEQTVDTEVPWTQIDDNFYYAQGVAYVLRQMMAAVKYDFSEILGVKNASALVDSTIDVLDQAQFEPLVVLNGDVGSLTANHSMELHSLLESARQKIRSLNDMLRQ
jgi:hypothetical protein